MKPVVVKYQQKHHLYNLENDYRTSCLILDVCSELDVPVNSVHFKLKCGTLIPEDCVISDLPDFDRYNILHVFMDDVHQFEDETPSEEILREGEVPITVELPSKDTVERSLKPHDTFAALIGELILEQRIDLNLDITLSRKVKSEKNSTERDRSPMRMEDIIEKHGIGCNLINDVKIKDGDVLNVVDKEATKENSKNAQTELFLSLLDKRKQVKWGLKSSSSVAEAFGLLLTSGLLSTRFDLELYRKNSDPVLGDDYLLEPLDEDIFRCDYDKRQSIIKKLNLREGDKIVVLASTLESLTMAEDRDDADSHPIEKFNCSDLVKIIFHGFCENKWEFHELMITKEETIATFMERIAAKGVTVVDDLLVDGRSITDPDVPLQSDPRKLIDDCGIMKGSDIIAKKPTTRKVPIRIKMWFTNQSLSDSRYTSIQSDATGSMLRDVVADLFNIAKEDIGVIMQMGETVPNSDSFGLEISQASKCVFLDWIRLGLCDGRASHKRLANKNLIRILNDDDHFLTYGNEILVLHVWQKVHYYRCPNRPGLPLEPLPDDANGWENPDFVAFAEGVKVSDKLKPSSVRYLIKVRSGSALVDIATGVQCSRNDLLTSTSVLVPQKNRVLTRIIIFMESTAFVPVHRAAWMKTDRITIFTRQNYEGKCDDNGTLTFFEDFTTRRIVNDPFQWSRCSKSVYFEEKWASVTL